MPFFKDSGRCPRILEYALLVLIYISYRLCMIFYYDQVLLRVLPLSVENSRVK